MDDLYIQMRYVAFNKKLVGPLVIIAGLILSIWTNCVLVVASLSPNPRYLDGYPRYPDKIIIYSSQATHLLITLTGTLGLIHGIKKRDRVFLKPWLTLKVIECIVLFTGSIILAIARPDYIGLMPVGILLLLIGAYITLGVWDTYKIMDPETSNTNDDDNSLPSVVPEKPPSYDSFTNQSLTT